MRGLGLLERIGLRGPERVTAREGYARWAPVYPARPHNALMEAEADCLAPMVRGLRPRRALDAGTGTGRNLELLRSTGAAMVTGIDLSPPMLACGTRTSARVCGDAQRLPFRSGAFDLVTSSLMCGDVPDLGAWIGEAARVLGRGGRLVYSDFHPSWSVAGWRRTFTGDDGRSYELPFFPHTIEAHLEHLEAHGMRICAIREPRAPGRALPVVVVLHAVKPVVGGA